MAKRKPKAQVQVVINDDTWTCRLWRAKAYEKMHGDDSGAITDVVDKFIDFRDDEFNIETVGHELTHVYFKYLHLDSVVDPKMQDIEEIFSSWLGANFQKFYEKTFQIFNGLSLKKDVLK